MRGRLNLQGRTATQLEMFPQWGAGPRASRQKPANDDSPFEQVGRPLQRALAATDDRFKVGVDDSGIGHARRREGVSSGLSLADLDARCGPADGYPDRE